MSPLQWNWKLLKTQGVGYAADLKLGESAEFATEQDTPKSDLLRTKGATIDVICCTDLYY